MSTIDISTDIISNLFEYMTPLELCQRRTINPIWNQVYLRVLPKWSQTTEPWLYAIDNNQPELLRDLLRISDALLIKVSDKGSDIPLPESFDGESGSALLGRFLSICHIYGYVENAKILTEWAIDKGQTHPYFSYSALYDPRYLRYYLENLNFEMFIRVITHIGFSLVVRLLEVGYERKIIDDEWLIRLIDAGLALDITENITLANNIFLLINCVKEGLMVEVPLRITRSYHQIGDAISSGLANI